MKAIRYVWDRETGSYVKPEYLLPKRYTFIKQIPYAWITKASRLSGKSLQAALAIQFVCGITNKSKFKVSSEVWGDFGIERKALYRALEKLEKVNLIAVERTPGHSPYRNNF